MKEKYIDEGFDDYISKPMEKQEIERVFKRFLLGEYVPSQFEPLPDSIYEINESDIDRINKTN